MKQNESFQLLVRVARYMIVAITALTCVARAEWLWGQPDQPEEPIGTIEQCLVAEVRYQAVWREGRAGKVSEFLHLDLSRADFNNSFNNLWHQGFRIERTLTHVLPACAAVPDARERIDVLWVYAPEVPERWSPRLSRDELDGIEREMSGQGWGLHTIDAYNFDGQIFYNAVWRMIPIQTRIFGHSFPTFKKEAKKEHDLGLAMTVVDSVMTENGASYSAAWEQTTKPTMYLLGYAPQDFSEVYANLRRDGWNIVALNAAGQGIDASLQLENKLEKRFTDLSAREFDLKAVDMGRNSWHLIGFAHEPSP